MVDHRALVGRAGVKGEIQRKDKRSHHEENLTDFGPESIFERQQCEPAHRDRNCKPGAQRLCLLEDHPGNHWHDDHAKAGQEGTFTYVGDVKQPHHPEAHGHSEHQPHASTALELVQA